MTRKSARSALSSEVHVPVMGASTGIGHDQHAGRTDGSAVRAGLMVGARPWPEHGAIPPGSSIGPARTEHTHAWLIAHLSNGL